MGEGPQVFQIKETVDASMFKMKSSTYSGGRKGKWRQEGFLETELEKAGRLRKQFGVNSIGMEKMGRC